MTMSFAWRCSSDNGDDIVKHTLLGGMLYLQVYDMHTLAVPHVASQSTEQTLQRVMAKQTPPKPSTKTEPVN